MHLSMGVALSFASTVLVRAASPRPLPHAQAQVPFGSPAGEIHSDPSYRTLTTTSNPDWMGTIPDSTSLAALSIPGTHESLAILGTDIAECQENWGTSAATLSVQLGAGIRVVDIRLRIESNNTLVVHHGSIYQHTNLDDVLTVLSTFLSAQPSETVLLRMKSECTGELGSCTDVTGQLPFEDIVDLYIAKYAGVFWAPSVQRASAAALPELGTVRGKVVLMALNGPHGGHYDSYGLAQFADWNDGDSTYVQDNYDIEDLAGIPTKRGQVQSFLELYNSPAGDPSAIYVNFCSGASLLALPYQVAGGFLGYQGVDPFLLAYLQQTAPGTGNGTTQRTSVVMMDFPGGGLIEAILGFNP